MRVQFLPIVISHVNDKAFLLKWYLTGLKDMRAVTLTT